MDDLFLNIIKTRRSCRKYKTEQVKEEALLQVLEAGTYAASGHGAQDAWIVAVQEDKLLQTLRNMNAKIMAESHKQSTAERPLDPYYNAPTIILVFASRNNPNAEKDASLVLGNMMLQAHAIGLASCWVNRVDKMFESEEGKKLLKDFGLEQDLIGIGSLALGYREGSSRPAKERKAAYYRIIK